MRLDPRVARVVAAAAFALSVSPAKAATWVLETDTNRMTDATEVRLRSTTPGLVVSLGCIPKDPTFALTGMVVTPAKRFIPLDARTWPLAAVVYRVDKRPAVYATWQIPSPGAAIVQGTQALQFLEELEAGRILLISAETMPSSDYMEIETPQGQIEVAMFREQCAAAMRHQEQWRKKVEDALKKQRRQ
jgi:hypothetical protein